MNLLQIALLAGYLTGIIWSYNIFKMISISDELKEVKGWYIFGGIIGVLLWPIFLVLGFVKAWRDDIQNR